MELAGVGDGGGAPTDRVEESFEVGGLVEAFGLWQLHLLKGAGAGLDFPDDLQFLAEGIVLNGSEADEVLRPFSELAADHAAAHVSDDVTALAHDGQLPLLGDGGQSLHRYRFNTLRKASGET